MEKLRAVGRGDGEPQSRLILQELIQVARQVGRGGDQPALRVQIVSAQRAVAAGDGSELVPIVDQHAEPAAEQR